MASPAGVPVRSTAEEDERCKTEGWPASMQLEKKDLCELAVHDGGDERMGVVTELSAVPATVPV